MAVLKLYRSVKIRLVLATAGLILTIALVRSSFKVSTHFIISNAILSSGSNRPLLQTLTRRVDWDPRSRSAYCRSLIENPRQTDNFGRLCRYDPDLDGCTNRSARPAMFSQFNQDYYLYTRHFIHLKRPGVYVDLATNEPYLYSNTYFLDKCLGWEGLCVEANVAYYSDILRRRSCKLIPTCASSADGARIRFVARGATSGIMDDSYVFTGKVNQSTALTYSIKCVSVKYALSIHGITEIDYFSLDVEGHELEVLKGIDFDTTVIKVMTVEGNNKNSEIDEFMKARGYIKFVPSAADRKEITSLLLVDSLYLHPSVKFGKPT